MSEFKINLYYTAASAITTPGWLGVKGNALGVQALVDQDNVISTEWSLDSTGATNDSGGVTSATGTPSGDAAWVTAGACPSFHHVTATATAVYKLIGPPGALFVVDCYSLSTSSSATRWSVNTQSPLILSVTNNFTETVTFSDTLDAQGEAFIYAIAEDGGTISFANALRVTTVDGPSLTATQTTITPGGTISGTYADYATIPTTLAVSDGTNSITIPAPTIVDNGTGGGTYSGTMPALPTTGSASSILFGDVTVELT